MSTAFTTAAFPDLLKFWRQRRRLSQLQLAVTSGVSQRHVSFLESGRAHPSREMILQLSESLEVPLRDRNQWLLAAGFAPVFPARPLEHPQMSHVMTAIRLMLANHEPFPAIAMDRAWNIRMANAAFERLSAHIGDAVWSRVGKNPRNLMRLTFHPEGIRPFIVNWNAIAPLLWCRAQREADSADGEDMQRVLAELAPFQDARTLHGSDDANLLPVLPVELQMNGLRLALFTVISTFGTPQDITADELRIESFFPADDATDDIFRGTVS